MKINIKVTNLDSTPAIREYIKEKIGSLDRFFPPKADPLQAGKRFGGKSSTTFANAKVVLDKSEIEVFVEIARTTKHHYKGDVFYAEATFSIGKKVLRAEHFDQDIRVAIDKVRDKLQREIKKHKEKQEYRP